MKFIFWNNKNGAWVKILNVHWETKMLDIAFTRDVREATALNTHESIHFNMLASGNFLAFMKPDASNQFETDAARKQI